MKIPCEKCGLHFGDDYNKSLRCGFWKTGGYELIPPRYRRKLWDFMLTPLFDEMYEGAKVGIEVGIRIHKLKPENDFRQLIPNYEKLTEEERQAAQVEYFRKMKLSQKSPDGLDLILRGAKLFWKGLTMCLKGE